jgi:hypothetical protein
MILWAASAMLCLVAGFGLGWYEHDLRWQIARAVLRVQPKPDAPAPLSRVRPRRDAEIIEIFRDQFPDSPLLMRRSIVLVAAPACFLLSAVCLVMAIMRS